MPDGMLPDEMQEPAAAPEVGINDFLSVHKRVLDALPRLQDEAIETGDYTKVDEAQGTLDRLEGIGKNILNQHGAKMPDVPIPSMLGGGDPLSPEGMSPEWQAVKDAWAKRPPQPAPSLLQPTPPPQPPIVVNVNGNGSVPSLLQDPNPAKDQYGSIQDRITKGQNAIRGFIKGHQDAAARNASQAAAAGGMAMPFNPSQKQDETFESYLAEPESNLGKAASDLRALSINDKEAKAILSVVEEGHRAQQDLANMRRPGQPLGLTREEVMPLQPKLLREREKGAEALKSAGQLETPILLDRQRELDTRLKNVQEFDAANPAQEPTPESPVGLLEGEPGEAETKSLDAPGLLASTEVPPIKPEGLEGVEPPAADFETAREPQPDAGLPDKPVVDAAKIVAKGTVTEKDSFEQHMQNFKRMAAEIKKIYTRSDDDVTSFNSRVLREIGPEPKHNKFVDYLALVLTGGKVAEYWQREKMAWKEGRQRIGSEMMAANKSAEHSAANAAASYLTHELSNAASDKRQDSRDKAASDRLAQTLGLRRDVEGGKLDLGKAKLEESKRSTNIRANLQKRQQDIDSIYKQAKSASDAKKQQLMPLHDQLQAIAKMQSMGVPPEEIEKAIAPIIEQMQGILNSRE